MSWNFVRFHELNFELNLKVSAFYLEKQKNFITKKNFKPSSISKQKSFVYWLNFSEGFDLNYKHFLQIKSELEQEKGNVIAIKNELDAEKANINAVIITSLFNYLEEITLIISWYYYILYFHRSRVNLSKKRPAGALLKTSWI